MNYIESRDKKMLDSANRFYSARRIFAILSIMAVISIYFAFFGYKDVNPLPEREKLLVAMFTIIVFFLAYIMHLKIKHLESIQHYLKGVGKSEPDR